ncbi:MAG: RpiB/LacA/LacB family sugar-phosphate isomerase [Bryobacterales bacterium]|nr:RpiB/LacA/LacB family sugar-phosphate isomerase [Bryobacterales bacterium]
MKLGIAADHGGYALKVEIAERLAALGHEVVDFGAASLDPADDYPDFVIPMAKAVSRGDVERGIALCGSGIGACVAVNKVRGVRASIIQDPYSARQGVEDDDMNVVCMGGRTMGVEVVWPLLRTFLEARFSGGERHRRRLAKVAAVEEECAGG